MQHRDFDIDLFVRLGNAIRADRGSERFELAVKTACEANPWFTPADIDRALNAITDKMLRGDKLSQWLSGYGKPSVSAKRVGVIMAGNIPLVGFFDMLCVLVCGHVCCIKPSSKDRVLIGYITELLKEVGPDVKIEMFEPDGIEALIATGGNEANRYFRSEYGHLPSLLRSSRTSVAVVDKETTNSDLRALADDIFAYSSMGCRSVTHLLFAEGFDMDRLTVSFAGYRNVNRKFHNAYRYLRAELRSENRRFIDGSFFILRPSEAANGRIGEVTYNFWSDRKQVAEWLSAHEQEIQCVVGKNMDFPRTVGFGCSQSPELNDYPDGKDVVRFLLSL